MKTLLSTTFEIGYAYPSSPNADKFGFRNGCWCVERVEHDSNGTPKPPVAIKAFATQAAAQIALADAITARNHLEHFANEPEDEKAARIISRNPKALKEALENTFALNEG